MQALIGSVALGDRATLVRHYFCGASAIDLREFVVCVGMCELGARSEVVASVLGRHGRTFRIADMAAAVGICELSSRARLVGVIILTQTATLSANARGLAQLVGICALQQRADLCLAALNHASLRDQVKECVYICALQDRAKIVKQLLAPAKTTSPSFSATSLPSRLISSSR